MTTEGGLKCMAIYDVNERILTVYFNKEINLDKIPIEEVKKKRDEDEFGDICIEDNEICYERQLERLEMFLFKTDGVNCVPEIKKHSVSVEVEIFSDFCEVAKRIIDLMICLVFSGEEPEIISWKKENHKIKNKKEKKNKAKQKSTKSQK